MSGSGLKAALPNYEVGKELGRGAMGQVYSGHHTRLDRAVAIKQLPENFARDATVRSRFGDEARVLASLTHPHIVPVYDYVEDDGVCLLVMEALPGGTVWDRFTTDGVSMPTACAIALATCAGLAHADDKRVLHRDIKPENLMFDAENTLKVTDFGIAAVLGGDESLATADGEIIGTPAYMAPEQAEGGSIGPAADVYAVGTMLYELLSGRLPFDESGDAMDLLRARTTSDPIPLNQVAPQVPAPLVEVTMHVLARYPDDRPAGPEEFGVGVATAAATAWGPEWKSHSDLQLMTTGAIADAATATPEDAAVDEGAAPPLSPTGSRETVAPGSAGPGSGARETVASGSTGDSAAKGPVPPPDGLTTGGGGRAPSVKLAEVDPDELVQVADVLRPPRVPWIDLAATAALVVAIAFLALTGLGTPDRGGDELGTTQIKVGKVGVAGDDPVPVDLSDPVPVVVRRPPGAATSVELSFSLLGAPLGTSDKADLEGGANLKEAAVPASSLRVISSGPVTGEVRLLDDSGDPLLAREFEAEPEQPFYLSASGLLVIVLILIVFAYGASTSAKLRRGRRDRSAHPKLAIVGAVGGVTATLTGWAAADTDLTIATMVVTAALGAVAAMLAGWSAYQLGRRRRLRIRAKVVG